MQTGFIRDGKIVNLKQKKIQWWDQHAGINEFGKWVGDANAPSRRMSRSYIMEQKYKSILDCGAGLCAEYYGYDKYKIDYFAIDSSRKFVERGLKKGINITECNINDIERGDDKFDICYCRHVLEHLKYYEDALNEMIRVAKKEVLVIFFLPPILDADKIVLITNLNHNIYNRNKLVDFIYRNPKVESHFFEGIANESLLHILLRDG